MHAGAACHSPWLSQICGMLPTHIFAPGVQTPTQLPAEQMLLHGVPRCQLPFASQVSGVFISQVRSPGMQSSIAASTVPPPSFCVDPPAALPPTAPAPPVPAVATLPPRPPGALPAPAAPDVPAPPDVAAAPVVPPSPEVPAVPGVPASSSTALIDPHAAAYTRGSKHATRPRSANRSASRIFVSTRTVEDCLSFIVRRLADLNAQSSPARTPG